MGDAKSEYKLEGLDDIIKKLTSTGGNLQEYTPVVAEILASAVQENFDLEGNLGGKEPWLPSQRAELEGGITLQDNGILAGTMGVEFDAFSATVFPTVPYGKYHAPDKQGRDFLAIDFDAVSQEVEDFLLGEILQ